MRRPVEAFDSPTKLQPGEGMGVAVWGERSRVSARCRHTWSHAEELSAITIGVILGKSDLELGLETLAGLFPPPSPTRDGAASALPVIHRSRRHPSGAGGDTS